LPVCDTTNQAKLIGILYLENNLTPRVFTPDRVTVLKVLAPQAAIFLENTWLYRDLEDREGKIRHLVDANILGIFIWKFEGCDRWGQRSVSAHAAIRP
jgi:GAF domain-containing protein